MGAKASLWLQEEEAIALFGGGSGSGAGAVTAVRIVRDAKTGKGKGIAFVEFAARGDARMALALDGSLLRGRAMRVTRVARLGAGDAQEGPGSRLRTPFSRGAGPLQQPLLPYIRIFPCCSVRMHEHGAGLLTARLCAGVKPGQGRAADGRRGKAPAASATGAAAWQGLRTKGVGKVVRGSGAKEASAKPGAGAPDGPAGKRKAPGKRPAVMARKAKMQGSRARKQS